MPDEQKPESAGAEKPAATNGTAAAPAYATLLDKIVIEGRMARDASQQPYAKDLVGEFVGQVLDDGMVVSRDTMTSIKSRIAQIDELLSAQLNALMHHPDFQTLEASWRGLHYLVMNTETGSHLKIRLLNTNRSELVNDLEKAVEFDQSQLFKKIYEEEYGTFGGNPYSLLVGDFEFGRHPQDIGMLEKISNVAAAAHAPYIAAASAKLFDWDSFTEMNVPRDLPKGFETAELIKWRSFRNSEDSRYVALVMPHILLRLPYGPDTVPVEGFNFVENVNGKDHSKYLWGNAAYAMAQRIGNAFSLHRWCAAIRGVEGGGIVEGLPTHTFKTDQGDIALKCPTEIAITDRREKELSDLGFIALCHCKGTDYAAFFGGQTTNKPKLYNTNDANANSRISSMLPYILASSRFAHYLKVIMRDKIGSFMTRDNVQKFLNTWISDYVLLNDEAPQSVKAKFPLRDARVDVTEVAGKPGCYKAVVYLKPHFQLDELTVSLRLVADLPAPAAA
jgi:type VI secretion system protein ImpC